MKFECFLQNFEAKVGVLLQGKLAELPGFFRGFFRRTKVTFSRGKEVRDSRTLVSFPTAVGKACGETQGNIREVPQLFLPLKYRHFPLDTLEETF
jgi:hypothetical protein